MDANESSCNGQYIDIRLERVRIRQWTNVTIMDDIAAQAISLFLLNKTPGGVFFDIDLFLDDLVNGDTRFCSRLLVNSVLAQACVSLHN
jgi:hypothetical protein